MSSLNDLGFTEVCQRLWVWICCINLLNYKRLHPTPPRMLKLFIIFYRRQGFQISVKALYLTICWVCPQNPFLCLVQGQRDCMCSSNWSEGNRLTGGHSVCVRPHKLVECFSWCSILYYDTGYFMKTKYTFYLVKWHHVQFTVIS